MEGEQVSDLQPHPQKIVAWVSSLGHSDPSSLRNDRTRLEIDWNPLIRIEGVKDGEEIAKSVENCGKIIESAAKMTAIL